jgi:hypothetical protein
MKTTDSSSRVTRDADDACRRKVVAVGKTCDGAICVVRLVRVAELFAAHLAIDALGTRE